MAAHVCLLSQDHQKGEPPQQYCLQQKQIPVPTKKRLKGVVTSSPSPDYGILAVYQMDAYDEQLDLHMDMNLTTLPTPHP